MDRARKKLGKKRSLYKIKAKKKVGVLRTKKPSFAKGYGRAKRKIRDLNPDIIFDSTIGKIDSLFVNKPEQKI